MTILTGLVARSGAVPGNCRFHALDVGTNYFGLWTEADNIRRHMKNIPTRFRRWSSGLATAFAHP